MAIYRTGQASMDADGYITGYGTKWKTALTLIRPGATIVFASNPVTYATISEIVNDTSMRATSTGGAVVPRGDYVILLHDSITVDGLAQDVAETLRYYQGKETMYEQFVEFLKNFDWERMEQLGEKVYSDAKAAEASANAAKASETNANASKNAAAGSATTASQKATEAANSAGAARTSETNANASKNAAASSATAAANSATTAGQHKDAAAASASAARTSEGNASSSKNAAAASASAAKTSETNAKASETSATASKNAAKTSEDNAAASKNAAASSASAAAGSATAAAGSATKAKQEADRAASLASQLDATNLMRKDANLSDVVNKESARANLQVDRLVQGSTSTTVGKSGGNRLAVNDGGEWGALDSGNNWIALGVGKGGTGAGNPLDARRNIEAFHAKSTALTASDNLNTIYGADRTGYYYNPMNTNATAANNYPAQIAGVLLVTSSRANGSQQTYQYYYPFDKHNEYYSRSYNKATGDAWAWSGWNKHVNAYNYGVGKIANMSNDLRDASCQFISDADGATNWAPTNGAGFQASYNTNRIFQFWIDTPGNAYIRYVDTTNPKESKTSKPWKRLAVIESAPVFTGSSVSAESGGKRVTVGTGGSDVYMTNSKSGKYLQLKDDGSLQYDSKYVMHRLMNYEADYEVNVYNFRVVTRNNGFQIKGNANNNIQSIYYSGINGDGTRAFWVGNGSNDRATTMYNDAGSNSFSLLANGDCKINTKGGGQNAIVAGSGLVVSKGSRTFTFECDANSTRSASFRLWGNTAGRSNVVELGLDDAYLMYCQQNSDASRLMQVNGSITATAFNQGSDIDLKENVELITNATESLRKMGGYTYTLKDDGMPYAGVIAQEVMEALPEAVSSFVKYGDELHGATPDGSPLRSEERFLQVDYSAVTGLLVQVCRESDERISKLESLIEAQKAEIESLKSTVASMQAAISN
nr:MAG TPA: tail protein [Caudoviricetes sp.]